MDTNHQSKKVKASSNLQAPVPKKSKKTTDVDSSKSPSKTNLSKFVVNFSSKNKNHFTTLSNFYVGPTPLVLKFPEDDKTYFNGEAAFHALKMIEIAKELKDEARKSELLHIAGLFETSNEAMRDPLEAKRKGGKKGYTVLAPHEMEIWDRVADDAQRGICRAKLEKYPQVSLDLKDSGSKPLVHSSRTAAHKLTEKDWSGSAKIEENPTSGEIKISILGGNRLGKIWMEFK